MTDLGENDDVALIGTETNTQSSYNKGPRPATDKISGGVFIVTMLAFLVYGSIKVAGNDSTAFILDFFNDLQVSEDGTVTSNWLPASDDVCCNNATDSSCAGKYDEWKDANSFGPHMLLLGDPTDPNACEENDNCINSCFNGEGKISADSLRGDVASPLVLGIFGSIGMGCLLLLGFQKIPYSMVYFVVAFKILVPFVLGCVVYSVAGACIDKVCLDDNDAGCTGKTQQVCGSPTPAYVFFAISAIVALVAWWYRDVLRLVAKLFQVSSVALTKNWQLLPFGALLAVSKLVVLTGMWSLLLLGVLTMDIKPQPHANAMIKAGEFGCYPDVQSHVSTYISFATFTMGWFSFWALETRNYIVADTIGAWYWHGTKGASVIRATKHAFCSHFGSMALAGAVMWFCEYLKKKAKYKGLNPALCMLKACAMCILSYLEFLCTMGVVVVAITGQPFIDSGKQVVGLFTASFGNMKASTGVWIFPGRILGTFVGLLSFAGAGASGYLMYNVIDTQGNAACGKARVPVIFGVIIGIVVLFLMLFLLGYFASILLTVIDTVYMCYIIDKSKGVVTHEDLHNIMNEVLASRKDVKLLEAQQQQIQQPGGGAIFAQPPPSYAPQQQYVQQPQQQQYVQQPQQFSPPPPQQQYVQQPQQFSPPPPQQQQSSNFCGSCGTQNGPGIKFCMSCGAQQ